MGVKANVGEVERRARARQGRSLAGAVWQAFATCVLAARSQVGNARTTRKRNPTSVFIREHALFATPQSACAPLCVPHLAPVAAPSVPAKPPSFPSTPRASVPIPTTVTITNQNPHCSSDELTLSSLPPLTRALAARQRDRPHRHHRRCELEPPRVPRSRPPDAASIQQRTPFLCKFPRKRSPAEKICLTRSKKQETSGTSPRLHGPTTPLCHFPSPSSPRRSPLDLRPW